MGVIKRGIRNAFRNMTRTFSIVLILGLSIGLALTMLIARQAVQARIDKVKSSTGNTVSISPAGMRGFEGSGSLLTTTQLAAVSSIDHVSKLVETLSDRLTKDTNTSLEPSQEMGSFGQRQRSIEGGQTPPSNSGSSSTSVSSSSAQSAPKMPIMLTGTNSLDTTALAVSQLTYTSGQGFDAASSDNVAIVGKSLASKNNLSVGSTFTVYDTTVKVVGIYDTGNDFSNNGLVMPLATVQKLTDQVGEVSAATVVVDSIDNLDSVKSAVTTTLGSDKADVTTSQEAASSIISQFDSIKNISVVSLVGALVTGATIILLTMMMIARERRREIGVLKAIGATDTRVISQFAVESLTLTGLASIVGLLIGVTMSGTVMNLLVTNSQSSATGFRPGSGMGRNMMALAGQGMNTLRNIQTTVGWDIILYGIGAALLIAIVGSVIPAWFITKIRPAEVMRAE